MKEMCVPFTKDGSLVEWTGYVLNQEEESKYYVNGLYQSNVGNWHDSVVWKPNTQFNTTLFYEGFGRGRSSIKFEFKDSAGKRFYMFATDLNALIKHGVPINEVNGVFEFVKRGQNYGIRFVGRGD